MTISAPLAHPIRSLSGSTTRGDDQSKVGSGNGAFGGMVSARSMSEANSAAAAQQYDAATARSASAGGLQLHSFAEASLFGARAVLAHPTADLLVLRSIQPRALVSQSSNAATAISAVGDDAAAITAVAVSDAGDGTVAPKGVPSVEPRASSAMNARDLGVHAVGTFTPDGQITATQGDVRPVVDSTHRTPLAFLSRARVLTAAPTQYSNLAVSAKAMNDSLFVVVRVDRTTNRQMATLARSIGDLARGQGLRIDQLIINGREEKR